MPRYPNDESLMKDENFPPVITRRKRCNCCNCNKKDVCIMSSTFLCIILLIGGLTILNIYFIQKEDGSL